jgi:5-formyltetrahydrofolate cyclo-ligase
MDSKEVIRKSLLTVLRTLTYYEVKEKSDLIIERVWSYIQHCKCTDIFSYFPNGKWEVDVKPLLYKAVGEGIRVWLPRIDGANLVWHKVSEERISSLKENKWGILEPLPEWEPQRLEACSGSVCIVPGIAFDRCGNRIGRGKGYFDRFLRKSRCYAIGGCFTFQIVQMCPSEVWDIKMDRIITEEYEFVIHSAFR